MSFLAPLLAAFTALAAIPILIHLLNRSRYRTVAWGAMAFLLKTLQQNRKRLQLRDLLLMILRTAAILLAALALARPTLTGGLGGGSGASAMAIVLDTSRSMGAHDGVNARLEAAKERAKAAAAGAASGSACALVLLADTATSELTEPTHDLGFITSAVERVTAADGGTRISAGLGKARELLSTAAGRKDVVLITDLQASGWSAADDPGWMQVIADLKKDGVNLIIADIGHGVPDHVAIDRVATDDDLVTAGDTTTFLVTLRNFGAAPATNVAVDLYVTPGASSDTRQARKVAGTIVESLGSNATGQARLTYRFAAAGPHQVTVRITPDALPSDNERVLVVDVLDRLPVLIVDGTPAQGGQWSGGDFLRAALSPAGAEDESQGSMALTRIAPAEIATANLERYRCVILSDVEAPSPVFADALASRVRAGMGLILLPGPTSQAAAWTQALGERCKLLPAELGAVREHAANGGLALATDQLDHPLVRFFNDTEHRPFWAAPRFLRSFALGLPAADSEAGKAVRIVARFADGSPYCVERTVGTGSVLLFASALDRRWSDMPLRPAFVMTMTRAVQHAALGWSTRQAHLTNGPLSVEVPARYGRTPIRVRLPDGTSAPLTPVPGPANTLRAEVASTARSGFYRLWAENAGSVTELGLFAVNAPAEESDLTPLTREQAQNRLGALRAGYISADEDAAAGLRRARGGIELWPWLLGLAIAGLLVEMFLAQHWAPRDAGGVRAGSLEGAT